MVTDPSSGVVPNAKVDLSNVNTGVSSQGATDSRGAYLFTNLQPGAYKITVTASGFQTTAQDNVAVGVNEVRRADFHVQLAQSTQTVEVAADALALQTDKSDVHLPTGGAETENG